MLHRCAKTAAEETMSSVTTSVETTIPADPTAGADPACDDGGNNCFADASASTHEDETSNYLFLTRKTKHG